MTQPLIRERTALWLCVVAGIALIPFAFFILFCLMIVPQSWLWPEMDAVSRTLFFLGAIGGLIGIAGALFLVFSRKKTILSVLKLIALPFLLYFVPALFDFGYLYLKTNEAGLFSMSPEDYLQKQIRSVAEEMVQDLPGPEEEQAAMPGPDIVKAAEPNRRTVKFDGISTENNRLMVFISQGGKISSMKVGDAVCGGELAQIYFPREPDGITSPQNVDQYEYRIKVRFGEEEKVFKNGDVICGDAADIQKQKEDLKGNDAADDSKMNSAMEAKTSDQTAPGMNHVRNAEESFKNAQDAEQKGLYRKAVFFYEQAVQCAQWALAYIIEDKRVAMKGIIREGEQKKRNLAGKKETISPATLDTLPKFKNAREIMKWVKANIKYKSDLKLHGERNYWQTPEETVALRAGDCEDYAFLVQALLKRINIESFVISVHGEGISKQLGHALCVFPKNSPTNYFDNQVLYTSGTHVVNLISSAYPLWQRMYVLNLDSRTKKQVMQRSGPSISKVDEVKNGGLLKAFLGEWYGKF